MLAFKGEGCGPSRHLGLPLCFPETKKNEEKPAWEQGRAASCWGRAQSRGIQECCVKEMSKIQCNELLEVGGPWNETNEMGSMSEVELIGFSKIKPPGNWEKAYTGHTIMISIPRLGMWKKSARIYILGYTKVLDVGGSSFTAASKVWSALWE